jgi:hypothetical protein
VLPASGPPAAKKRGLFDHRSLDAIYTSSNIVLTIPASRETRTSCFVFGSVEYPNGILPAIRRPRATKPARVSAMRLVVMSRSNSAKDESRFVNSLPEAPVGGLRDLGDQHLDASPAKLV